jgi:phenylalanyl-tRNA synthetase beta chain
LDLHREVDLIEEVARLHGLERIAVRERIEIVARAPQPAIAARQALGEVLVAHGYHETITFAFLKSQQGLPFVPESEQPLLIDEESRRVGTKAEPMLRPSLLPSLLVCRKLNQDAGNAGLRLFEVAATWSGRDGQIIERQRLALLADPPLIGDMVGGLEQAMRQLCGTLDELVARVAGPLKVTRTPVQIPNLSSAARVELNGYCVGYLGVVESSLVDSYGLSGAVVAAELDVDQLLQCFPPSAQVSRLARFPAIERDISIVVDEQVRWDEIERHVIEVQPAMFESLQFLIIFRGRPVPMGRKSVSFRMVFRDPDATLRRDLVDGQVEKVVKRLETELGAQLRQ